MNTALTTELMTKAFPRTMARITGVVYLLFFVTAVLGEVFLQQAGMSAFSVSGEAAATANTIL